MHWPGSPAKTCCPRARDAPTQACTHWARWHRLRWRHRFPEANLARALNRTLPASIRVLSATRAGSDFHARHSAQAKTYEYRIFRGEICPPWQARYVYALNAPLDVEAMQRAAALGLRRTRLHLLCRQRPRSAARFTRATCAASTLRSGFRNLQLLLYRVRGNGFLHHMVRNLVGTFLEVGRGNLGETEIPAILEARARERAGPTAPARGLFLVNVDYASQSLTRAERVLL